MDHPKITLHRKLVRDRIPAIIEGNGGIPVTVVLDDEAFANALFAKMKEELAELRAAPPEEQISELADIQETFSALVRHLGHTGKTVRSAAAAKYLERGGFSQRIWLESTPEQP